MLSAMNSDAHVSTIFMQIPSDPKAGLPPIPTCLFFFFLTLNAVLLKENVFIFIFINDFYLFHIVGLQYSVNF